MEKRIKKANNLCFTLIIEGTISMDAPRYIRWFVEESSVTFKDGKPITCYKLSYELNDDIFDEWALHIRRHYEADDELAESISATEMDIEDYLRKYVIPQKTDPFGPTARSNDFTEIMVSDLLQFVYGYTVPRCKQDNRSGKANSEHGTDILGYKYKNPVCKPQPDDELVAVEVKAGLSSDSYEPIQKAVTDSKKYDAVRYAHTLNFYRKTLSRKGQKRQADDIARFQKKSENNFILTFIAAAIISRENIPQNIINIKCEDLELISGAKVFLFHGKQLMALAHEIYERCIK